MRHLSPLIAVVCVAALALAGCGRRGPLELPPGAPPQPAAQAAAQQNQVLGPLQDRPGVIQSPNVVTERTAGQKLSDVFSEGEVARPINAPPEPKKGFILDPLL